MLNITDEDILFSEDLLLRQGETFNNERKEIIKSLITRDIKASPGSGKTTTLLAKLAILCTKLPLVDNSGICILTHTNVAIDEIKGRLGTFGQSLFRYPNNCSTIQSFVNQYLAIQGYIHFYGKRPIRIDNQIYIEVLMKNYYRTIPRRLRFGLEQQGLDVTDIKYNLQDGTLIKGLYGNQIYKNQQSDSYIALKVLKESVMAEGILSFDDAYYLAFKYLREHPELKNIFSKRFRYIFIDEMQDKMDHQKSLLDSLFDESVIIQRIGDPNQSIYDQPQATGTWEVDNGGLEISDSKRFSPAVAAVVQNICVSPQTLVGNPAIENISPCILVYNSENIKNVLPHFSRIIIENKLHTLDKKVFKAVGWVAEHEKEIGITNYWDTYRKEIKKKIDFKYLNNYLIKEPIKEIETNGSDLYRKNILRGILKALREMEEKNDNKYYTESSFLKRLQEINEDIFEVLLLKLSKWCLDIQNNVNIFPEVKLFISTELKLVFKWENILKLDSFLLNQTDTSTGELQIQTNTFIFNEGENVFNINISSIHSVKGETHTATLYLETFFHGYDIKRIINYLKGNHKTTRAKRTLQNLKMAYVGMTRPSHLLCVAVNDETINGQEDELKKAGWNIEYVTTETY